MLEINQGDKVAFKILSIASKGKQMIMIRLCKFFVTLTRPLKFSHKRLLLHASLYFMPLCPSNYHSPQNYFT